MIIKVWAHLPRMAPTLPEWWRNPSDRTPSSSDSSKKSEITKNPRTPSTMVLSEVYRDVNGGGNGFYGGNKGGKERRNEPVSFEGGSRISVVAKKKKLGWRHHGTTQVKGLARGGNWGGWWTDRMVVEGPQSGSTTSLMVDANIPQSRCLTELLRRRNPRWV